MSLNCHSPPPDVPGPQRLLMVACACDPVRSMESRLGWNRAIHAARWYETWVLHDGKTPSHELACHPAAVESRHPIHFMAVTNSKRGRWIADRLGWFWTSYRLWHREALKVAHRLHEQHHFDLVHQANYCGYREPGYTWKLGVPFVWGPIGGTQNFPLRFISECDAWGALREVARNVANAWQLRATPRVIAASRRAATIVAATSCARADLRGVLGVEPSCQLETGIDQIGPPRSLPATGRPFRILWAGRLRTWKGFPLLLKALAQLPEGLRYEVRVLGIGSCANRWQRQAERLGLSDRITWLGWPAYADSLLHYAWADATVFTSLRDTSGTGLLESLAAGTPVIGLDHQGAADILTPQCGIPIQVTSPRRVAADIAVGLERLATQPSLWLAMSRGAQQRAHHYTWDHLAGQMELVYRQALGLVAQSAPKGELERAPLDQTRRSGAIEAAPALCQSLSAGSPSELR